MFTSQPKGTNIVGGTDELFLSHLMFISQNRVPLSFSNALNILYQSGYDNIGVHVSLVYKDKFGEYCVQPVFGLIIDHNKHATLENAIENSIRGHILTDEEVISTYRD